MDDLHQRSRDGFVRTLAWCRDHLGELRGLVTPDELDGLLAVFEGRQPFEPRAYTHLFNLSQVLPELPRPPDLATITLGDAIEVLADRAGLVPELHVGAEECAALGHDTNVARLDAARAASLPGWQAHAEQHQQAVVRAMDCLVEGRVSRIAYVGAGRTYDVPLEALFARADEVLLVDVDGVALESVRRALPAPLRERSRCLAVDVTGMGAPIRRATDEILARAATPAEAADALAAMAMRGAPAPFLPDRVDLIVSGMVLSQLSYAPFAYPHEAFRRRFGDIPARLGAALAWLPVQIQHQHLRACAALTRALVLSSDVAEEDIVGAPTGDLLPSGRERPTVGARRLSDRVPHGWRTVHHEGWHWYRELPRHVGGKGTRLRVEAMALQLSVD